MSDDITFGEPHVEPVPDGTQFTWYAPDGDPIFRTTFEDMHEKEGGIYADITAWWLLDQPLGVRPVQPTATLKLNSSHITGWRSIPKVLGDRIKGVDFEGAMTTAVHDIMEQFKGGEPAMLLGRAELSGERPFILDPFVSSSGVTVLYGEGGLSKSLLALTMAVSISTGVPIFGMEPTRQGPVVFFDYEDDSLIHDLRLQAVCNSFGIDPSETAVYHFPLVAKVSSSKRVIEQKTMSVGAVLGVLDSVGMGRGGSAVAAEDTIRMFRSLRSVGVPFLAIDHVSKDAKKDKGEVDAYGSIYTMNSARLAWHLSRQMTNTPDVIRMRMVNTKANHVAKQKPRVIEVRYVNDDKGVPQHIHIETSDDFGIVRESVPLRDRVARLLADGEWRTYAEIADHLNVKEDAVRQAVTRDALSPPATFKKKGTRPDRITLCDNTPVTDLSQKVEDG